MIYLFLLIYLIVSWIQIGHHRIRVCSNVTTIRYTQWVVVSGFYSMILRWRTPVAGVNLPRRMQEDAVYLHAMSLHTYLKLLDTFIHWFAVILFEVYTNTGGKTVWPVAPKSIANQNSKTRSQAVKVKVKLVHSTPLNWLRYDCDLNWSPIGWWLYVNFDTLMT